jgi:hypothetical protein
MVLQIIGQAVLAEMDARACELRSPRGLAGDSRDGRDQALSEMAVATWLAAMEIVARQCEIKLV